MYYLYLFTGACKTTSMMEDPQTPGSDCNSNPASEPQDLVGSEFIQDNMDYQWFIDYRWLIILFFSFFHP